MPTCPNCGTDNPDGFRFCGQCGTPLAETAPERRKTVTLLFCDVSGSTALGERLEAESVREVMLRYFEEMRVVIERHSGTVEKFVGDAVMAVFGEPVTLKGKAKPVPAYRLVAVAPDGAARVGHAGTALVGREEELAALEQEFDAAVAAAGCRLVTILGEPGIGKSRLGAELLASVESEARILTGRCLSYGEGITYWALGEIVRQAAGIEQEDAAPVARERIATLLAAVAEDARKRVLEAAAGIPLFVEELLAILVEDGLVRQAPDGRWVPHGSLADFAIPPTIDALLAERLDRLQAP